MVAVDGRVRARLLLLTSLTLCLAAGAGGPAARAGEVARYTTSLPVVAGLDSEAAGVLVGGPVLAGDRVVWAQNGADQSIVVRSATVPGFSPRTLATLRLPAARGFDGDSHQLTLYGGPDRLAWFEGVEAFDDAKYQQSSFAVKRFVAGPPGGPFTMVAGCDDRRTCRAPSCFGSGAYGDAPWAALVGDTLLLTTRCGPDDVAAPVSSAPGTTVPVRTLWRVGLDGGGAATPLPAADVSGQQAGALSAAGDLVAVEHPGGRLTLQSATDGHTVAELPPIRGEGVSGTGSLQADGKLVLRRFRHNDAASAPIELRVPGDPVVHVLDVRATDSRLALAADRMVFKRAPGDGSHELTSSDLAGRIDQPLVYVLPGDRTHRGAELRGFARVGDRVAWIVTRCEQTFVGVSTVGTDAPIGYHPAVCATPRIVPHGPLRLRRDGRVSVPVTCGEACHGTLHLRGPYGSSAAARFRFTGSTRIRRVVLRVPAAVRREVERRGSSRLTALLSGNPSFLGSDLPIR